MGRICRPGDHTSAALTPPLISFDQVEAEAELQGWQGFRGWARIQSHAETTDHSRKLASAIVCRWRRSGHVTWSSAWLIPHFFKITNNNQHASNIEYLANLIKKYWTCFRYQKLADFLVCFPSSVRVQVRWPPSWKICLRINLALVFEAVQSRPSTTSTPESWHDYWKQYFRSSGRGICLPDSPNWRYRQNYDVNWQMWIREAFLGRISASLEATDGCHCWQNILNL